MWPFKRKKPKEPEKPETEKSQKDIEELALHTAVTRLEKEFYVEFTIIGRCLYLPFRKPWSGYGLFIGPLWYKWTGSMVKTQEKNTWASVRSIKDEHFSNIIAKYGFALKSRM